jgi:hypothetical protein
MNDLDMTFQTLVSSINQTGNIHVNFVLVNVGTVADGLEVYAASIFRVEEARD